jgi:hypothetical protein
MRHALAILVTALVVTSACAREYPDRNMQPDPGTGYAVTTTGAQVIGRDDPYATTMDERRPLMDGVARRLATAMCDREARCHGAAINQTTVTRTAEECWNANLGHAQNEIGAWRCSPAAMRARVERCLASVGTEPCEHVLGAGGAICARNAGCEFDVPSAP